jgi:hypothetical protein
MVNSTASEFQERFVDHEINLITATRPSMHPQAEWHVHRVPPKPMRDPLHQEPTRRRKPVQQTVHRTQISRIDPPQLGMNLYARSSGTRRLGWAPHMDVIASISQALGDKARVVTHTANLWRVFGGDEVPGHVRTAL